MKQLPQGNCAELRMLRGACQVIILYLCEQGKAFLTAVRELSHKLLRRPRIEICVLLIWIEIGESLPGKKRAEADRKNQPFRDHQVLQAIER